MVNTETLISILIPVANGAEYLFEALQSVLNQTYTHWECWVALNGEGLAGPAEAVAAAFQDPRIHILHLPTATTKVAALNAAVPHTKGEWIALLDADDRWHPTKLAKQVAILPQRPAVVGTRAQYFGEFSGVPDIPVGWINPATFYMGNPIINSSAIIHKSYAMWEYVAPYTDSLEDYYMWMRIVAQVDLGGGTGGKKMALFQTPLSPPQPIGLINLPEILVDHRIYSTSAFNSKTSITKRPEPHTWFTGQLASRPITTIVTTSCNNPVYIRAQYAAFCRYVPPPWRFVVFNDAKAWPDATNFGDSTMPQQIEAACSELRIPCISVPNQGHRYVTSASQRHCDTLRFVMDFLQKNPGQYWMLDSDMWPVAPYSVEELQRRFQGSGTFVQQRRGDTVYAWPNLWWLDTTSTPTLPCWDLAPGCDTGGASAPWIQAQLSRHTWLDPHLSSCNWTTEKLPNRLQTHVGVRGFLTADPRNPPNSTSLWAELYDDRLFHVRAGSNWNGEGVQVHQKVAQLVKSFFA